MAEESYKPNGWLGLQLGKRIWIAGWSVNLAEQNFAQMLEKAKASGTSSTAGGAPSKSPTAAGIQEPSSSSSSSSSSVAVGNEHHVNKVEQLQKQIEAMQTMMAKMQQQMEALTKDMAELKSSSKS